MHSPGLLLRAVLALMLALLLAPGPSSAQGQPAPAERRVALVIGNGAYERAPLVNPRNDAADLAAALRRLGFEVIERHDRNQMQMSSDLREFRARLGPGTVGLFYFAGHGVQSARGQNVLLPVGMDYQTESDAEIYGHPAGTVLEQMEAAGTSLSIVILDACRDAPLPAATRSRASRGLGRMDAHSGSLVAFATAPGRTADENRGGRNGLYTQYLLQAIETPGLRLEDVFQQVRRSVEAASAGRQSPEEVSKLTAPFYFRPAPGALAGGGAAERQRDEALRREWSAWQARMQRDFDDVRSFQGSPDLRARAWERFLATWAADNPLDTADEGLRDRARAEMQQAQRDATVALVVPTPAGPVAGAAPGSAADRPTVTPLRDCADCPEMVVVPAGSFLMGSAEGEDGRDRGEGPQRRVTFASAFAIGRYEVTQGQWRAVMGGNPSRFKDCGDDCPVETVSWDDVQQFIRRLNQRTGQRYRLPSEAEWEYAARAGTTTPFHTGQTITPAQANFDGNHTYNGSPRGVYRARTVKVGSFPPNAWGLHDVHGNVSEFVQDCWERLAYAGKAPSDGTAYEGSGCAERVHRGGPLNGWPFMLRSAFRAKVIHLGRYGGIGFRLARDLP